MVIKFFSFLSAWLCLPFIISAQSPDTSGSAILFQKLMKGINPKHVSWVKNSAKIVNEKNPSKTETGVKNLAEQYGMAGGISGADIDVLAFMVMMQAAKDAQEDLKTIMAKVKSMNDKKAKMREMLAKLNESNAKISRTQYNSFLRALPDTNEIKPNPQLKTAPTKLELEKLKEEMNHEMYTMSEMGETESLKMQMAMDRVSKFMSTLANLLKKISKTSDEIIANLK